MPFREWRLAGTIIGETTVETVGFSLMWYCYSCGLVYAAAECPRQPWKAIGGCCCQCNGHRWIIPGTLETIMLAKWKVPREVLAYQLARELDFTTHPDHPWNKKGD